MYLLDNNKKTPLFGSVRLRCIHLYTDHSVIFHIFPEKSATKRRLINYCIILPFANRIFDGHVNINLKILNLSGSSRVWPSAVCCERRQTNVTQIRTLLYCESSCEPSNYTNFLRKISSRLRTRLPPVRVLMRSGNVPICA